MKLVRTADRTLGLFEVFERIRQPLSLSEIAKAMELPLSTCHGLVRTLQERGYMYSLSQKKSLYPTRKILYIAENIVANDPVIERMLPGLALLRDSVGETVIIGKQQADRVLYLDVLEGLHIIRYSSKPGDFKPLHSSSMGKALLGALSDDELNKWLAKIQLKKMTESTITSKKTFLKTIEQGRTRGYFVTHGENVIDVNAIAVSLKINNEIFAVAIAAPSYRMQDHEEETAKLLLKTKARLLDEIV